MGGNDKVQDIEGLNEEDSFICQNPNKEPTEFDRKLMAIGKVYGDISKAATQLHAIKQPLYGLPDPVIVDQPLVTGPTSVVAPRTKLFNNVGQSTVVEPTNISKAGIEDPDAFRLPSPLVPIIRYAQTEVQHPSPEKRLPQQVYNDAFEVPEPQPFDVPEAVMFRSQQYWGIRAGAEMTEEYNRRRQKFFNQVQRRFALSEASLHGDNVAYTSCLGKRKAHTALLSGDERRVRIKESKGKEPKTIITKKDDFFTMCERLPPPVSNPPTPFLGNREANLKLLESIRQCVSGSTPNTWRSLNLRQKYSSAKVISNSPTPEHSAEELEKKNTPATSVSTDETGKDAKDCDEAHQAVVETISQYRWFNDMISNVIAAPQPHEDKPAIHFDYPHLDFEVTLHEGPVGKDAYLDELNKRDIRNTTPVQHDDDELNDDDMGDKRTYRRPEFPFALIGPLKKGKQSSFAAAHQADLDRKKKHFNTVWLKPAYPRNAWKTALSWRYENSWVLQYVLPKKGQTPVVLPRCGVVRPRDVVRTYVELPRIEPTPVDPSQFEPYQPVPLGSRPPHMVGIPAPYFEYVEEKTSGKTTVEEKTSVHPPPGFNAPGANVNNGFNVRPQPVINELAAHPVVRPPPGFDMAGANAAKGFNVPVAQPVKANLPRGLGLPIFELPIFELPIFELPPKRSLLSRLGIAHVAPSDPAPPTIPHPCTPPNKIWDYESVLENERIIYAEIELARQQHNTKMLPLAMMGSKTAAFTTFDDNIDSIVSDELKARYFEHRRLHAGWEALQNDEVTEGQLRVLRDVYEEQFFEAMGEKEASEWRFREWLERCTA